jgi:hypothetical protein
VIVPVVEQMMAGNQITVSIYRNLPPDVACIQMRGAL